MDKTPVRVPSRNSQPDIQRKPGPHPEPEPQRHPEPYPKPEKHPDASSQIHQKRQPEPGSDPPWSNTRVCKHLIYKAEDVLRFLKKNHRIKRGTSTIFQNTKTAASRILWYLHKIRYTLQIKMSFLIIRSGYLTFAFLLNYALSLPHSL